MENLTFARPVVASTKKDLTLVPELDPIVLKEKQLDVVRLADIAQKLQREALAPQILLSPSYVPTMEEQDTPFSEKGNPFIPDISPVSPEVVTATPAVESPEDATKLKEQQERNERRAKLTKYIKIAGIVLVVLVVGIIVIKKLKK